MMGTRAKAYDGRWHLADEATPTTVALDNDEELFCDTAFV
jgi:hypothetical protein